MASISNVFPRTMHLAGCLSAELTARGVDDLCFVGVVAGGPPSFDFQCSGGKCGMAWVRLLSAFPSSTFPVPDTDPNNCAKPVAFELEMGIVRCALNVSGTGVLPSAAQQVAKFEELMVDMEAMWAAMQCCFGKGSADTLDHVVGSYSPYGPQGGLVGGMWTITVRDLTKGLS